MIERIEGSIIWEGRTRGMTWFHPRACMFPTGMSSSGDGWSCLMTCQDITGSDVFGQVHWSISSDLGVTWTQPRAIASLGRHDGPDDLQEGVCDVVPEYHAATDTVLAIGHNVYYKEGVLARPDTQRHPVYAVYRDGAGGDAGAWSDARVLAWDDPRGTAMYTCGCAQRVTLESGELIIPLSFAPLGQEDRMVGSVRCRYDGQTVEVVEAGNELRLAVKRGLLEPTLTRFDGQYWMTIRAEDDRGYVSVSEDGLTWPEPRAWCWDDGEPLTLSTTQQRWVTHSEGLFLVYTRRAEHNAQVMRWRSPLWIAQVDVESQCLIRDSEKTVLPLIGDGVNDPDHVARMGNFHTVNAAPDQTWVTVGETLPADGWAGNTLLGRIYWSTPNRLAPA